MTDTSNRLRRLVREWARIAHERDLRRALGELGVQYGRWERGEIDSFELKDFLHQFHDRTLPDIWKAYAANPLEPAVASALAAGVLRTDELPAELVEHVAPLLELFGAPRSGS